MLAPTIRHLDTADLSTHGKWLLPRLMQTYPHLGERAAASFLQTVLYHNEYQILYQDHSVALVQVMAAHSLTAQPVVYERLVWVEDKENKEWVKQAADFYVEIRRWAKGLGAEAIIVEENTDVPHEMIKEKLGRIFQRPQQFARL